MLTNFVHLRVIIELCKECKRYDLLKLLPSPQRIIDAHRTWHNIEEPEIDFASDEERWEYIAGML